MAHESAALTRAMQQISLVLAATFAQQMPPPNDATVKATRLAAMGFSIAEIANILGISSNHVSVALYKARKPKKPKKQKK
jgi:hypothetical protein